MLNFIISILVFSGFCLVKDPIYDDLEGLELIAALIKDDKLDLAKIELENTRPQNLKNASWSLLNGKYFFKKSEWDKALINLTNAIHLQKSLNEAKLFLAKTYFETKQFSKCAEVYSTVPTLSDEVDIVNKSFCEFKINKSEQSFATLSKAYAQIPSFNLGRELIIFKLKLNLNHDAFSSALKLVNQKTLPLEYLNLAEIFHGYNDDDHALKLLEVGRAFYKTHVDINLTFAQLYFAKGLLRASAEAFEMASIGENKYYYHASEIYRQIGNYEKSKYLNQFIADATQGLKQKIALYIDQGKFSSIASLESAITRSQLIEDDEIKYALAYSLVRFGQLERPLKYLSTIQKPELLEKTALLRKSLMENEKI